MDYKAKQLFLHCGLAKTGTSALQRALFEHRDNLYSNYTTIYPGGLENHHYLPGVFAEHPEDNTITNFSSNCKGDFY